MNHFMFLLQVILLIGLAVVASTIAFSPYPYPLRRTTRQLHVTLFGSDEPAPDNTEASSSSKTTTTEPQWGVSYIGGDPCGSKYNDDPFDVQGQKPGMPDDMKARIQALVDQKQQEEKENESK
jgi:hypothetical protein